MQRRYGTLRCLLSNCTYVSEVEQKGKTYAGQHEPIVARELFDKVQTILASRSLDSMRQPKLVSASLLQGLIFDCHGRRMGPAHTTRNGQRFRYYVTHSKSIMESEPAAYRLSAEELEQHCATLLADHVASQVGSVDDHAKAKSLAQLLLTGSHAERRACLIERVRKIVVGDAKLSIELVEGHMLQRSLERVRHGNDARLLIGKAQGGERPKRNAQLLLLLQDANRARTLATTKPKLNLEQLAAKFGRSTERYKRLLRLSYLSPTIVTAIIQSSQPGQLTNRHLQNLDRLPLSWADQEKMLLG
ncbi:MAG: hypothetical protein ABIO43_07375 [Sphingomicrobium sp.]